MAQFRLLLITAAISLFATIDLSPARAGVENVNMNTSISVQSGKIVAHWNAPGYGHYNVRWSANGGPATQVERDGDKDFVFLTDFRRGVVYTVAVQGCDRHTFGRSECTSWEQVSCGDPRNPCDEPPPRPIISGGRLCLDVDAPDQRRDGGRVQLWTCNGSDQQLWTIRGRHIVSLAGKCLDVRVSEMQSNGGHVQVWTCNGSPQQTWRVQGGQFRNQGGKCLAAQPSSLHQNGGVVQVWDCDGSVEQRWGQPNSF